MNQTPNSEAHVVHVVLLLLSLFWPEMHVVLVLQRFNVSVCRPLFPPACQGGAWPEFFSFFLYSNLKNFICLHFKKNFETHSTFFFLCQ